MVDLNSILSQGQDPLKLKRITSSIKLNDRHNELDLYLIQDEGEMEHSNSNILKQDDSVASGEKDLKGQHLQNCDLSKIGNNKVKNFNE